MVLAAHNTEKACSCDPIHRKNTGAVPETRERRLIEDHMMKALSVELAGEAALSLVSISVRRAQPIEFDASPLVEKSGTLRGART